MTGEEILKDVKAHRKELLELADKYGAKNLRIFGSVARGEAQDGSDIDLLVELTPGHGFFSLVAFEDEAENLLHRKVDVVTEGGVSRFIREEVLSQAKAI